MSERIDYYFTCVSPFTYLGHAAFLQMAARQKKQVHFKPIDMMKVWEVSGAVPPFKRPPVRQRYRLVELQRIAQYRSRSIAHMPTNFPTDPTRADLICVVVLMRGGDVGALLEKIGEALWVDDRQLADEAVLAEILTKLGHEADEILSLSHSDEVNDIRANNSQDAIAADAVGAPAYAYQGEVFWGQDRIEHLEQMISSGRKAFVA